MTFHVKRSNKFGINKVTVDGMTFDSRAEANRYFVLRLMEKNGNISELVRQPPFALIVNGIKVGRYTPDFSYFEQKPFRQVVEDTKGFYRNEAFGLRSKLFMALYPHIELRINGVAAKKPKPPKIKRAA